MGYFLSTPILARFLEIIACFGMIECREIWLAKSGGNQYFYAVIEVVGSTMTVINN